MAKKKKAPVATEDHLDSPAITTPEAAAPEAPLNIPPPPDTTWRWPDSTETRNLIVKHDDHARSDIGMEMSRIKLRIVGLEDEKKGIAQSLKTQIDDLDARLEKYAHILKNGGEERPVACRWIFEVSGMDAEGQWMRHPEYKCLVREDTGEVVSAVRITEQDRQANLDLGEDESALTATLTGLGYTLNERETPGEDETAFYMLHNEDGTGRDIDGDCRLTALKNAITLLRDEATAPGPPNSEAHDAYNEGVNCRRNGEGRDSVTYAVGSEQRAEWLGGWDDENVTLNEQEAA